MSEQVAVEERIRFGCGACGRGHVVRASCAGRKGRCACGEVFRVPPARGELAAETAAEPAAPAPRPAATSRRLSSTSRRRRREEPGAVPVLAAGGGVLLVLALAGGAWAFARARPIDALDAIPAEAQLVATLDARHLTRRLDPSLPALAPWTAWARHVDRVTLGAWVDPAGAPQQVAVVECDWRALDAGELEARLGGTGVELQRGALRGWSCLRVRGAFPGQLCLVPLGPRQVLAGDEAGVTAGLAALAGERPALRSRPLGAALEQGALLSLAAAPAPGGPLPAEGPAAQLELATLSVRELPSGVRLAARAVYAEEAAAARAQAPLHEGLEQLGAGLDSNPRAAELAPLLEATRLTRQGRELRLEWELGAAQLERLQTLAAR